MPSSYLYAINTEGRVFGLSTSGSMWREFMYLGLEFKHVSAVPHFMWAIGGDRQVYVHVHGLDVPIRIKEETYENEVGRIAVAELVVGKAILFSRVKNMRQRVNLRNVLIKMMP